MMKTLIDSSNAQNKTKLFTRQIKQYFHSVETPSMITGMDMILYDKQCLVKVS